MVHRNIRRNPAPDFVNRLRGIGENDAHRVGFFRTLDGLVGAARTARVEGRYFGGKSASGATGLCRWAYPHYRSPKVLG